MEEQTKRIKPKRSLFHKIVNVFIYAALTIFVILLFALGFSQTSTFRELLRTNLVEMANEELNGKLYIERIDGTILSSILLYNTNITMGRDTLFKAETIELKTSPLKILFKIIYLRKFELRNAKINLIRDENGELNIGKLIPPSAEHDTTASTFPFKIQVADFKLTDVDFTFRNTNSTNLQIHDDFNLDDLAINKINLSLSAFADIAKNSYSLDLMDFNFNSNIRQFGLRKLSGDFLVTEEGIGIKNLMLETEKSFLTLNSAVSNFNLFDTSGVDLKKAKFNSYLNVSNFNFNDLRIFIPSSDLLQGDAAFDLKINGTLEDLAIPNLEVALNNSHLGVKGYLKNLLEPDKFYISADFYDSYLDQNDINNLLPSLQLPVYKEFGLLRFDSLSYTGKPLNFKSGFHLLTDKGELLGVAALSFEKEEMEYDLNFETKNFDASSFTRFPLLLNLKGSVVGSGTSFSSLNSNVLLSGDNSKIGNNIVEMLNFKAEAKDKTVKCNLNLISDSANINVTGLFDFTKPGAPQYDIDGTFRNLNLADILQDSTQESDLNFYVNASGEKFDLDSTNLFLSMTVFNSSYTGKRIDSSRAIVDLRNEVDGTRIINIISDIADITISGKYSLLPTVSYLIDESTGLTKAFTDKIDQIFPEGLKFEESLVLINPPDINIRKDEVASFDINYLVDFKDFYLLTLFLGENQLELDGSLKGKISNKDNRFNISSTTNLGYVKYWGNNDVFFLSDLNLDLDITKPNQSSQIELLDIKSNLFVSRIFAGSDFYNLDCRFNMSEAKAGISFGGTLEDYSNINLKGTFDLTGNNFIVELDTLIGSYQNFLIQNDNKINISYSDNKFYLNNFSLKRPGSGYLSLSGFVSLNQENDFTIELSNFKVADLGRNIANMYEIPDALINLSAHITGTLERPVFNSKLEIDSLTYKKKNFGSIASSFDYNNKNLSVLLNFTEPLLLSSNPGIKITGNIPIDFGIRSEEERLSKDNPTNFQIRAENFDIGLLSSLIPQIKSISGKFDADLNVSGTWGSLKPIGYIKLDDAYLVPALNNLEYNASLNVLMTEDKVEFEKLSIRNIQGTEDGGEITGSGSIILGTEGIEDIDVKLKGKLKILGEESRYVSPAVYGDLVVETNESIELKREGERTFLNAPINVKKADLKFTLTQNAYENSSDKFIYIYKKYFTQETSSSPDFDSLISLSNIRSKTMVRHASKPSYFDYKISIKVEDEAKIVFVLSKKLNQDLTAILGGDFEYEHTGGNTNVRGELNLLQGSQLEFFKSFEAAGTIKFENDIANPYLDVTATYRDFYFPVDSSSSGSEIPTAVKIKLKGLLSELNKNFISNKENIAVYSTNYNIDNDLPDANRDASDAVMFILTGKFTDGVSQQDRNAAASTATSLAGSIFSGLLNKQFGDYVRSLQLRQVGATTKFSLVGKAGNFRYEIGGSTDVFQDLSQANVKIEYPFFKNFVARIERKEAISQTTVASEMINELGLKYRFEF